MQKVILGLKKKPIITLLEQAFRNNNVITIHDHAMGGREFRYKGKEIGHIHWNGDLDILFTKAIRDELLRQNRVNVHKWIPESGWITYPVKGIANMSDAMELLQLSYLLKKKKLTGDDITLELAQLDFSPILNELL